MNILGVTPEAGTGELFPGAAGGHIYRLAGTLTVYSGTAATTMMLNMTLDHRFGAATCRFRGVAVPVT